MKRIICKIILAVLTLALLASFACCSPAKEQPTEKQVWLATSYIHHKEDSKGTYTYNEYGNMISNENYNLYDVYQGTWLYEYDERQNQTKRSVDTGKEEPFVQLINIYDENGRLIEEQQFWGGDGATYTYRYDKQGRVAAKLSDGKAVQVYIYAEDGSYRMESASDPANYTLYHEDGRIMEQHISGITGVYVYNEDNKLIEVKQSSDSDDKLLQHYLYELDEHGNNTRIYVVGSDGEKELHSEFTYELFTVKVLPES